MTCRASIVVPLLSQQDAWLRQCLHSALDQTAECEVIVVVSRHTTQSNLALLENLRSWHEALRIVCRPRDGFAVALNTGISAAAAERIGFLLSDDWLDRTAVEDCLPPSSDIVSTGMRTYDADGTTEFENLTRVPTCEAFERLPTLEAKASYLRYFFLFRKETLDAVGGVDESIGLTGADDYDLIWTLLEWGASVSIVEMRLYNCRDHTGQRLTLRAREAQIKDLQKILDKHGVSGQARERLIQAKSKWYGEPMHVAARRLGYTV